MKIIRINADEALWRNNMLPEGILECWLVADGDTAREGHAVAQIRIEGALHDIVAPATGRLADLGSHAGRDRTRFSAGDAGGRCRSRCGSLTMQIARLHAFAAARRTGAHSEPAELRVGSDAHLLRRAGDPRDRGLSRSSSPSCRPCSGWRFASSWNCCDVGDHSEGWSARRCLPAWLLPAAHAPS